MTAQGQTTGTAERMSTALEAASAAGLRTSPSRMRRLLRADEAERISTRRVISYRDPTGEAAVRNADRRAGRR